MSVSQPQKQQMAGQAAVLVTAFLWSTSGLLIKLLPWNPMVITGLRSFFAAVFILIVRLIVPPPKGTKNPPLPLIAGAIAYVLTMYTFVIANKLTTAANAIMLQYSAPAWAALLGWLLIREKPHWEHWGALALIAGGLFLFFTDSSGLGAGALTGDALALFSGVTLGANSVFLRMQKEGNPRDSMLLAHAISAVISVPFIFLYPPSLSVPSVLTILYMGFFQIGLASVLFAYGLTKISAVQAMLIAILEAILNPIWVLAINGEKPTPRALAGGLIIIGAVVASSLIGKRREDLAAAKGIAGS